MPYYRRNWGYRSWGRRYSVQRSQQQGTRRFKVTIPVDQMKAIPIGTDGGSYHFSVAPLLNIDSAPSGSALNYVCWGNLVTHPLFKTYCQLYDEVRIVGLKLCVSVMGYPSGVSSGGVKIVSSCDRRGNRDDVVNLPTTEYLLNSADSMSTEYTSLERAKQFRNFWARDMIEKCSFYDAGISSWNVTTGAESPYSYTCNTAWRNNGSSGFSPMVVYRVLFANGPTTLQSAAISIKASWSLEFRNPKWNAVGVSSAKFSVMKEDEVKRLVEGKDDVVDEYQVDSVSGKRVKVDDADEKEVVVSDDDVGMEDESSQPQLTKEELLEMLKKFDEKKS